MIVFSLCNKKKNTNNNMHWCDAKKPHPNDKKTWKLQSKASGETWLFTSELSNQTQDTNHINSPPVNEYKRKNIYRSIRGKREI